MTPSKECTFATELDDRLCPRREDDLSAERDGEVESEDGALTDGMFVIGSKLPPGLAGRAMRGHAIFLDPPKSRRDYCHEQLDLLALYYRCMENE